VALYDGTIDAQKALSAVARTGQRFGAGYLASLLVGEATEPMRRNGHDNLKTFGVGKDRSKQAWSAIYRQLFACEALDAASEEHGGFRLTEKGEAILLGRETLQLRNPGERTRRRERGLAANSPPMDDADADLLAKLKGLRRELARDEGVPAFMIFPDKTLLDMAGRRPATLAEMSEVHGVGQRKLTLYGEAFLEALRRG
jgi:ATP-dependent DNA helicase RecQ